MSYGYFFTPEASIYTNICVMFLTYSKNGAPYRAYRSFSGSTATEFVSMKALIFWI